MCVVYICAFMCVYDVCDVCMWVYCMCVHVCIHVCIFMWACMYIHMCMHIGWYVYIHVCICRYPHLCVPWRHKRMSGVLPYHAPPFSFETGSLTEPGAKLEVSKHQGFSCGYYPTPHPEFRSYMHLTMFAFCFVLFFKTGFLCATVLPVLELTL